MEQAERGGEKVKHFDPLVLVFYFMGSLVGLLLVRLVRMILTN